MGEDSFAMGNYLLGILRRSYLVSGTREMIESISMEKQWFTMSQGTIQLIVNYFENSKMEKGGSKLEKTSLAQNGYGNKRKED